jgi:hypothetical protein
VALGKQLKCFRSLRRAQPVDLTLRLSFCHFYDPSTSEISGQNSGNKYPSKQCVFKDLVASCGEAQQPILAIGRTGDSPARRMATLTMVRILQRPTPPNLRCSAIFCDAAADGFGMTSH